MLLPEADVIAYVVMADVVACRLMELSTVGVGGRWNGHWVNALVLIFVVLCKTSSHMCGRWYLPIFLLRDGSLTLMNRASLIALVRFWSSLPIMLKLLMSAL